MNRVPLLDFVGADAPFVFLRNEHQESYEFALNCIKSFYRYQLLISETLPLMIVLNKDHSLINAIRRKLPLTDCMICIWHINKNILSRAKPLFRRECTWIKDNEDFSQAVGEAWKVHL